MNKKDAKEDSPYKVFCQALKTFIRDLIRVYPDSSELKMVHAGYKIVKTVSKKLVQSLFQTTVEPYRDYIIKRDDSFFPNFTLPDDYGAIYKALLPSLQNMWKGCDDLTRDAVWSHMQVLLVLSDKCAGAVDEEK